MVRINLLPPEILEKRKAERVFSYVALGGVALAALLLVVYGVTWFLVDGKAQELQSKKDQAIGLQKQGEAFRIFETKEKDLEARVGIVDTALARRVDWARLFTELSLVLPSEMWTERIQTDEVGSPGMQIEGKALDPADTPDSGHKVIAKALVRLADLDQLVNAWLKSSEKESEDEGLASTIKFGLSADVVKPGSAATATASAVPAPPPSQ